MPLALLGGGTLSLWQFALLHDVKHGTAALPKGLGANKVLFWGSLPSVFGYYLYLRYGHLSHHRRFGEAPLRSVFDSEESNFEDGDTLFVAHRQHLASDRLGKRVGFVGPEAVGGLGVSISRSLYSLGWRESGVGAALHNALVFSFSMAFERVALCFNDKVVALVGRNFFFPNKPAPFHMACAKYARASALLHAILLLAAGPGALLWLYLAEIGWQLPIHPASAMFVSNHPSLEAPQGPGGAVGECGCQPTASVYLGGAWEGRWYDWLCCFSNYHTEHHDFPDVPAFELRKLRDLAPSFYADEVLSGCRDGWLETMRRSFAQRDFYACAGAMAGVGLETDAASGGKGASPTLVGKDPA